MLGTIQAGRALAAIAVVMFHLSIAMGDVRYGGVPVFGAWTSRGNLGVDFFFVISGFIMMYIHQRDIGRPDRWLAFARARFLRLFPVYWLYTLVFCLLVALGFGTVTQLPGDMPGWLSTVLLVRLTDVLAPLGVAWTLFHEIAFYAVFSLMILNRNWGVLAFGLWMVAVALAFGYPETAAPRPIETYLAAYNLDFLIGIGACAIARQANMRQCIASFSIGAGLLVGMLCYERDLHVAWGGLVYGLAFGGIVGGMAGWELRRGRARILFARLLGDASYTIYLVHVPVIGLLLKVAVVTGMREILPGELLYGLTLAAALAISLAIYRGVEQPLQSWLRRRERGVRLRQPVTAIS